MTGCHNCFSRTSSSQNKMKGEKRMHAIPSGLPRKQMVATIYVCSPYRPVSITEKSRATELEANIQKAKKACRLLTSLGYLPLAPHLYFTQFLDDEVKTEREDGLVMAMEWLETADEVWVFGDRISEGMAEEIARAKELGKTVRNLPEPGRMVELILKALGNEEEHEMDAGQQVCVETQVTQVTEETQETQETCDGVESEE